MVRCNYCFEVDLHFGEDNLSSFVGAAEAVEDIALDHPREGAAHQDVSVELVLQEELLYHLLASCQVVVVAEVEEDQNCSSHQNTVGHLDIQGIQLACCLVVRTCRDILQVGVHKLDADHNVRNWDQVGHHKEASAVDQDVVGAVQVEEVLSH